MFSPLYFSIAEIVLLLITTVPFIDVDLSPLSRSARLTIVHRMTVWRNLLAPFVNPRVEGMDPDSKALEEMMMLFYPQLALSHNITADEVKVFRKQAKHMFTNLYPSRPSTCVVQGHVFQHNGNSVKIYFIQHNKLDDWEDVDTPLILYLHGGGFVFGDIDLYDGVECDLSKRMNMLVIHVAFDLAPEHTVDKILVDITDVYQTLLYIDPNIHQRLIGMGDSSGGMLWIYLLQWMISNNISVPQGIVLHSPWPNLNFDYIDYSTRPMIYLTIDMMFKFRQLAIGEGKIWSNLSHEEKQKYSPIDGLYQGFPPLYITAGTRDICINEVYHMTDLAVNQGVQITLRVLEGMMHAYPLFHLWSAKAQCVQEDIHRWIKEKLHKFPLDTQSNLYKFC
ncbi:unnamed protein product [Adineta ricciae]|uniref:Alpha/beta hydrolase fold-3 domain-containing protein n=1 Tax=Adineta ricciae TaxID=249248 RepID=A0A813NQ35_ADIRI|nr:unnamed protein product [Adineta ricciae]CAF0865315.1 unnamed protein product [Adineta ricciae]